MSDRADNFLGEEQASIKRRMASDSSAGRIPEGSCLSRKYGERGNEWRSRGESVSGSPGNIADGILSLRWPVVRCCHWWVNVILISPSWMIGRLSCIV